jgi:glycosyltransferase involved in cell wall biosynthesis
MWYCRDEKYLKSISGPTVEFLGNLSDEELTKTYQQAKAFLFASVDEEFGIAPVEAMGYGLPVIAFKSGGIPEYLVDKVNGYLFDQLTPNSLIEKINQLENLSKEKYQDMKKNARLTAEKFLKKDLKRKSVLCQF